MAKFNVYVLGSHRPRVVEIQSYFLKRVVHKDWLKIYFLATRFAQLGNDINPIYEKYSKELKDNGIDAEVVKFDSGFNYMDKIRFAQGQDSEYSVKLDEDLWFNEHVWDFIMENISILDDPKNLCVAPLLSNGIPTCDYFIQDFMTATERDEIHRMILKTKLGSYWGVDYSSLNAATIGASTWDSERFYSLVQKIPHHYKGIHPVRINYLLNRRINDFIVGNYDKFCSVNKTSMRLQLDKKPYLCNSVFFIKSDRWRKIIENDSLYRDGFDEVPLNLYREFNDLNWVFVRNGYGMHMLYNTVCQDKYEEEFTSYCLNLTRCRY